MSMRADGLPIGDRPVFMTGADRFVEAPFGDSDMVRVSEQTYAKTFYSDVLDLYSLLVARTTVHRTEAIH